jgi:hypothetical protein
MKMRVNMNALRIAYPPSIQTPVNGERLRDPVDCCACAPSGCCDDPAEWKTRRNTKPKPEQADCCCHPLKKDKRAQLAAAQKKSRAAAEADCCKKRSEDAECCADGTCIPTTKTISEEKQKPTGCCTKFDEQGNKVVEDPCAPNGNACCPTGAKNDAVTEVGAVPGGGCCGDASKGCCVKGGTSTNGKRGLRSGIKTGNPKAGEAAAAGGAPIIEKEVKPPVKCCATVEREDPECCPNDIRADGDDCCFRAPCLPPPPPKVVRKVPEPGSAGAGAGGCCAKKEADVAGEGGCCGKKAAGAEIGEAAPKKSAGCCPPKQKPLGADVEGEKAGCCGKKAKGGEVAGGGEGAAAAPKKSAGCCPPKKAGAEGAAASGGCCAKKAPGGEAGDGKVGGGGCFGKKAKAEKAAVV